MVTRASARLRKVCSLRHSSRKRLLNDSTNGLTLDQFLTISAEPVVESTPSCVLHGWTASVANRDFGRVLRTKRRHPAPNHRTSASNRPHLAAAGSAGAEATDRNSMRFRNRPLLTIGPHPREPGIEGLIPTTRRLSGLSPEVIGYRSPTQSADRRANIRGDLAYDHSQA
jgi:hypothetical protein